MRRKGPKPALRRDHHAIIEEWLTIGALIQLGAYEQARPRARAIVDKLDAWIEDGRLRRARGGAR